MNEFLIKLEEAVAAVAVATDEEPKRELLLPKVVVQLTLPLLDPSLFRLDLRQLNDNKLVESCLLVAVVYFPKSGSFIPKLTFNFNTEIF